MYLTEQEAADYLGVSLCTLQRWRKKGRDFPPYFKLGRSLRYDEKDLNEWIEGIKVKPTPDPGYIREVKGHEL